MNTKIITALVIAFALVGLTGAASADNPGASYTGTITYDYSDSMDLVEPTLLDINSGAAFITVIDHFDTSYGVDFPYDYSNSGTMDELIENPNDGCFGCEAAPGAPVLVGGLVYNNMAAIPGGLSEGVTHQKAAQSGSATITIRSKDSEDNRPEVEADITSAQSLWYSGSFDSYAFQTKDLGVVGAIGLLSNGLDFGPRGFDNIYYDGYFEEEVDLPDDCGTLLLVSKSTGDGYTWTEDADVCDWEETEFGGAKLMGGTFSVATFEGMTVDLEGVPAGDAIIRVYGGAVGVSTFEGAVDDWEAIGTTITAEEKLRVITEDSPWTP